MAQYNQILTSRFNDHLRRLLGVKIPGGDAVNVLTPELQPSADVFSLQQFPEHLALQGIRPFAIKISQAAGGAGTFALVGIRNSAPNTICVVTYLSVIVSASSFVF